MCSGEEIPEVEIISLLEEQIPRYKLRADTLTQFGGYENEDWFIPSPALKPEEQNIPLSPDQIRETLNYFSKYLNFFTLKYYDVTKRDEKVINRMGTDNFLDLLLKLECLVVQIPVFHEIQSR